MGTRAVGWSSFGRYFWEGSLGATAERPPSVRPSFCRTFLVPVGAPADRLGVSAAEDRVLARLLHSRRQRELDCRAHRVVRGGGRVRFPVVGKLDARAA